MLHWYTLHTKPHKEPQVASFLRAREIDVYLPLVKVNPSNARAVRERSYFPCYLFARGEADAVAESEMQWTPGLRRVVEFNGQPGIVSDNFIIALKQRLHQIQEAGGLQFDGLHRGDLVKIVSGPFAGYEAIFDSRLASAERVRILIRLIQQSQRHQESQRFVRAELNAGSIEKVRSRFP